MCDSQMAIFVFCIFFFFNDTATTEIYTLSLHDALPIFMNFEIGTQVKKMVMPCDKGGVPVGLQSLTILTGCNPAILTKFV